MALSFLTGFSPVGAPRRPDAAPAQSNQPAAPAPARAERPADRRSAPAVQVRLSPEALAVLNGAPPPQAARAAAPSRAAAFEPLAFGDGDRPAADGATASQDQPASDLPPRPLRPGSRLDIKL
jgi:hypothetical protein